MPVSGWSTRQLAEFLEAISAVGDVATARRAAVDRAAEALDAEVAAIVSGGRVLVATGVDPEGMSGAALAAVIEGRSKTIHIPGVGLSKAVSIAVIGPEETSLMVARSGQEIFSGEELSVARSLAHALSMAERMLEVRDEQRSMREQSEEQARRHQNVEANYRSLVERLPAIVYSAGLGETGSWTYVSPQIEEILGFTPQEWMADPELWSKQLHPDDRERALAQENERDLGDRDPPPVDYRLLSADGREVWILDEAVLERDESGDPVWHGVLYDITKRKRAEEEAERRAAQQASVAKLGERALKGAGVEELVEDAAVFAAGEGFGRSAVWVQEEDGEELRLGAGIGLVEGQEGKALKAASDTPAGLAFASGRTVTVADWSREDRFEVPAHLNGLGIGSTIAVPIDGERKSLGVIEAHADAAEAISEQDVIFVRALANVLAHMIERQVAVDEGMLHDHITGLPNRLLFVDRVEHALEGARGRETPLAVFFCDLDHFKVINDSFGHQSGDKMLKAIVPRIRKQLRSVDTVARFGGDEFAILVEEVVDEAEASRIAERLCAAFEAPFDVEGLEQHMTASVGVAITGAEHGRRRVADPRRPRGDVPGQGPRPQPLRALRPGNALQGGAPPAARARAAEGDRP